jgi:hypothetical protein
VRFFDFLKSASLRQRHAFLCIFAQRLLPL